MNKCNALVLMLEDEIWTIGVMLVLARGVNSGGAVDLNMFGSLSEVKTGGCVISPRVLPRG